MDIRTFRAATLQEALEQVRATLGPDAAVLHTRQVKRSRMGLFSSSLIEVEASVEMPVAGRFVKRSESNVPDLTKSQSQVVVPSPASQTHSESTLTNHSAIGLVAKAQATDARSVEVSEQMATENNSTRHTTESQARLPNQEPVDRYSLRLPPAMYEALSAMMDAGVEPAEAKSLLQAAAKLLELEQLNDPLLLQGQICQMVSQNLRVADPIAVHQGQQAVVAMVGPTGVGKTTTLAKLATNFQLDHSCQVGLITMDTLRPGAVDQLLQYAESLDAALEVVSSTNQFLPALHRLKDCDVVFIDTAGRSPSDTEQIRVLQGLLEAAAPTSVQLVVSATSSIGHVKSTIEQFSPLNPTGLVITKLDEAIGFGSWLSVLQRCDLPVSYVTHGQHVPRDFSAANRRRLASLLLGHAT
jgi:flagellar biosynthesis protein FlhF